MVLFKLTDKIRLDIVAMLSDLSFSTRSIYEFKQTHLSDVFTESVADKHIINMSKLM